MLKIYVGLFCCCFLILGILTERKVHSDAKTTPNPFSDILSKFHQHDYKLTYEWAEVVRVDKRYGDYQCRVFKYNRTTTAVNATFISTVDMGNDVQAIVQLYKFASNEYRFFPLRLQFNFCEAMAKQAVGFDKLSACGNFSCPILKGKRYHYCNWAPEETHLPPLIPSGKYMVEVQAMYNSNELFVTRTYVNIYRPLV